MAKDKLLFTVPRKDLRVDFFRAGGPGGQHQNKTSSACRIVHLPSGAVGESRQERKQAQNKKIALQRLSESRKFLGWVRIQAAMIEQGYRDLEDKVDRSMAPVRLRVEHIVKYTCDDCKRHAEVVHLEGDEVGIPKGWIAVSADLHYCESCQSRQ